MTGASVKRVATDTWRSSFLGLGIMLAASLLWSVTSVLVLVSVGFVHVNALIKAVLILCISVVPGVVLVGSTLGYWIASARPSPIGTAAIAAVAQSRSTRFWFRSPSGGGALSPLIGLTPRLAGPF